MNDFLSSLRDTLSDYFLPSGGGQGGGPPHPRIFLAFSAGRDSSVLLHALCQLGIKPNLIHVHHGLSPQADNWVAHVREVANRNQLLCEVFTLPGRPPPGESIEAWAREGRYQIFEKVLENGGILFLAHHLDDQVETFLLQLLRGAGPKGLSSMPFQKPLGNGHILRPLLSVPREAIQNYAHFYAEKDRFSWITDESNDNLKFKRNALRHEVLPVLKTHFPGCLSTIARAARLCAEESELLNELVQQKLSALVEVSAEGVSRFYFKREGFAQASALLKRQLLRAWLLSAFPQALNEKHLKEIEKLMTAEHWSKSRFELVIGSQTVKIEREKESLFLRP